MKGERLAACNVHRAGEKCWLARVELLERRLVLMEGIMRKSLLVRALLALSLLGTASCEQGHAAKGKEDSLWTGSAQITTTRSTPDITVGYTMRSDFWFQVDPAGNLRGKAYAVYQPTFDPAGLNGKITVAKNLVNGALSLFPGGQIAVARTAIEAGKGAVNLSVAGIVGVVGKYSDPKPIRMGKISGSLVNGQLNIAWVDEQPTAIPVTVSLQYINKLEPIANQTLKTQVPWHKPATVDPESGGRFAIAQEQSPLSKKGDVTESMFAYWSATRIE